MSKIKAIIVGVFIWSLGSIFYAASYLFPFLEDQELQANLVLAIIIIPSTWLGANIYYKGENMHGLKFGTIAVLTAMLLDVIITVPFVVVPQGGNHQDFFSAPAFWLIALEYLMVVILYWYLKVNPSYIQS